MRARHGSAILPGAAAGSRPFMLAAVALLAGCSGLFHSGAPPLRLYVLRAAPPVAAGAAALPGGSGNSGPGTSPAAPAPSLRILRPLPGPGLDSDRIALLQPGQRFDYYAGSRWSAPLPEVLAQLAVDTFDGTGEWSVVADPRHAFNADYELQLSIHRFEADYSGAHGAPTVRVGLDCLLTRRADAHPIAVLHVQREQPAAADRMSAVVAAFEQAADAAMAAAAQQAAAAVRSSTAPSPP